jgi:L-lysine 2,3-aminomutase
VIVSHIDHIGEVSQEAELVIRRLRDCGVQFLNQTVLLRDVNDAPEVLAATFSKLHRLGVRPYYLFQARPVHGASHFQVPIKRGIQIVHDADRLLSGTAKTYRYVMSHYTGKIEILGISQDNRLWMRYHQARNPQDGGMIFSRPYAEGACWLDDLCPSSELCEPSSAGV